MTSLTKLQRKTRRQLTQLCDAITLEQLDDPRLPIAIIHALQRVKEADYTAEHPEAEQLDMFPGHDTRAWMPNRIKPTLPGFGGLS